MKLEFPKLDYLVLHVADMTKSVQFYRRTLELPLRFSSPEWSEFELGRTTLALQPNSNNAVTASATTSIGFCVDNVDAVYQHLQSKGAAFLSPPSILPGKNIKGAVLADPDGFEILLLQAD